MATGAVVDSLPSPDDKKKMLSQTHVFLGAGTHFTAVAAQPDLLGTLGLSI